MKIELKAVDNDNWRDVIKLTVHEEQKHFVADNARSLIQSVFDDEFAGMVQTRGIYVDDTLVGFVMSSVNDVEKSYDGSYWVDRYMIDKDHQGKGYGRAVFAYLVNEVKQNTRYEIMRLAYEPDNIVAKELYASFGFVEEGFHKEWQEMVAVLTLSRD